MGNSLALRARHVDRRTKPAGHGSRSRSLQRALRSFPSEDRGASRQTVDRRKFPQQAGKQGPALTELNLRLPELPPQLRPKLYARVARRARLDATLLRGGEVDTVGVVPRR